VNIYEKLQKIKLELLEANLKKTGENKFSKFKYYELSDFVPEIVKLCEKHRIFTMFEFLIQSAVLMAFNIEKPEETVKIECPVADLDLKGANKMQMLGGIQTYARRYLYMAMFDITENDMFDANQKSESTTKEKPRNIAPEEKDELRKTHKQFRARKSDFKALWRQLFDRAEH
jgi:hypothetical protein